MSGHARRTDETPGQAGGARRRWAIAVAAVLAAAAVLAVSAALFYSRWVKKPDLPKADGPKSTDSIPPDATAEPTIDIDAVQPKVGGERKSPDIYTILVFGADVASGLNDTIMVVTYDVTNQKATVMSIPRDTLINSSARGGINAKKINAAYNVYGGGERGLEGFQSEVAELVGFRPDFYVQIDWELVGEMVDAIGGVWFDIPYHMDYDDPVQELYIHFEPGGQFLNGADAMKVVRWRKNNKGSLYYGEGGGSDTNRLKVQHDFLKAVLKQTLQIQNITKITQLADLFSSRVESDLTVENLFWFGSQAIFGGLNVEDVEFCTMPFAYGSYYMDGQDWSFVYPIQRELLTLINQSLNPYKDQVTIRELDLMGVNADGSLRSSTGRLADPALGYPRPVESEGPEEGEPSDSGPLDSGPASGEPAAGDPAESGPVGSEPAEPEPLGAPQGEDGADAAGWEDDRQEN